MSPRPEPRYDQVWPGIGLCDRRSATDIEAVVQAGYSALLNVGDSDIETGGKSGPRYAWIRLEDSDRCDPNDFMRAVRTLADWRAMGIRVLVCCEAGEVRSPAVIAAYLVKFERERLAHVTNYLRGQPHQEFEFHHDWLGSVDRAREEGVGERTRIDPLFQMVGGAHRVMAERRPQVLMRPALWVGMWDSIRPKFGVAPAL